MVEWLCPYSGSKADKCIHRMVKVCKWYKKLRLGPQFKAVCRNADRAAMGEKAFIQAPCAGYKVRSA